MRKGTSANCDTLRLLGSQAGSGLENTSRRRSYCRDHGRGHTGGFASVDSVDGDGGSFPPSLENYPVAMMYPSVFLCSFSIGGWHAMGCDLYKQVFQPE